MARFSPQPEELGPSSPIAAPFSAKGDSASVAPNVLDSKQLAPSAPYAKVNDWL
jgi:hypothetical protein